MDQFNKNVYKKQGLFDEFSSSCLGKLVIMGVITASMSVGLAMFFKLGGFMNASEGFQRVVDLQDDLSLWAALFTYGIIGPIAEEMLFRGVIYGYVRKFFDVRTAIIGSSILFGVYHGRQHGASCQRNDPRISHRVRLRVLRRF